MSVYRVKVEVEFIVNIDGENENVPGPPPLQGDSGLSAVRRALWTLYRQDIAQHDPELYKALHQRKRALGVVNTLMRTYDKDIEVSPMPDREPAEEASGQPIIDRFC